MATGGGPGAPVAVAVPGGASAAPTVGLISAIAQLPAAVLAAAGVVVVGGLVAAGVALAAREVGLDGRSRDRGAGRQTLHEGDEFGAVRFAGREHAEHPSSLP